MSTGKPHMTVRVSKEMQNLYRNAAKARGVTMGELMTEALTLYSVLLTQRVQVSYDIRQPGMSAGPPVFVEIGSVGDQDDDDQD